MRKCTQCGTVDPSGAWDSPADAANDGAFIDKWACSSCAWSEFDLVEAAAEQVDRASTAAR